MAQKEQPGTAVAARAENISAKQIVGDADFTDKRFATIAARLCLAGYALHPLSCGGYLIARWDRTNYVPDLRGCEAFLDRIEGNR